MGAIQTPLMRMGSVCTPSSWQRFLITPSFPAQQVDIPQTMLAAPIIQLVKKHRAEPPGCFIGRCEGQARATS